MASSSGTGNPWILCKDDVLAALNAAKGVTEDASVSKHADARKIIVPALQKMPLSTHFPESWKSHVAQLNEADGGPFQGAPATAAFQVISNWVAVGASAAAGTKRKKTASLLVIFLQEVQKYIVACVSLDGNASLVTSDPGIPPLAAQTDQTAQSFRAG